MKNIVYTILIAMVIFLSLNNKSYAQSIHEIRLSSINTDTKDAMNNSIDVFLKMDSIQKNSAGSIKFMIKLVNKSNEDITIKNPLDFLQVMLIDGQGNNIAIPQLQRIKINTKGEEPPYRSFAIESIVSSARSISNDSLLKKEIIISNNSDYKISLKIESVLAKQSAGLPSNEKRSKIAKGEYSFGLTFSLIGEGIQAQIFQSSPLKILYQ